MTFIKAVMRDLSAPWLRWVMVCGFLGPVCGLVLVAIRDGLVAPSPGEVGAIAAVVLLSCLALAVLGPILDAVFSPLNALFKPFRVLSHAKQSARWATVLGSGAMSSELRAAFGSNEVVHVQLAPGADPSRFEVLHSLNSGKTWTVLSMHVSRGWNLCEAAWPPYRGVRNLIITGDWISFECLCDNRWDDFAGPDVIVEARYVRKHQHWTLTTLATQAGDAPG